MIQTTITNHEINTNDTISDDVSDPRKTEIIKTLAFFEYVRACAQKNRKHKEFYNDILDAYIKKFYNGTECYYDYVKLISQTPIDYTLKNNNYNDMCVDQEEDKDVDKCVGQDVSKRDKKSYKKIIIHFYYETKEKLMKTEKYKDLEFDSSLDLAINSFIDNLAFTMDTYKEIIDLRYKYKDNNEFRQTLISKAQLFERFILSINWSLKIMGPKLNISLLHNFQHISVGISKDGLNYEMNIHYNFNNVDYDDIDYEFLESIIDIIPNYYKVKSFKNNQEVFRYENATEFIEYAKTKEIKTKIKQHPEVILTFNIIALIRGAATKINYFTGTDYYRNHERQQITINISELQSSIVVNLFRYKRNPYKIDMKFDALNMHTNYNILCMYMLPTIQKNNIGILNAFSDKYVDMLMLCVQEKYKRVIKQFFDDLICSSQSQAEINIKKLENAKQECINIVNAIKSPVQITKEMDAIPKLKIYSEIDFVKYFENTYGPIYDKIRTYNRYNIVFSNYIHEIEVNTCNLLKKHIGDENFFIEILEIIKLRENIKEIYQKSNSNNNDDVAEYFAELTNTNKFIHMFASDDNLDSFIQNKINQLENPAITNSPPRLQAFAYKRVAQMEGVNDIIRHYKPIVIDVINRSLQLKLMIIEAEQKASELVEAIKTYIDKK